MMKNAQVFAFEADTKDAWKARVEKELKGKSYEDHLLWKSLDGFTIESFQNDRPSPLPSPPLKTEAWKVLEPIHASNAQSANEEALKALNAGAESIWFQKSFFGAAAEVAIKGINQDIAPVFIQGNSIKDPFIKLLKSEGELNLSEGINLIDGRRYRERGANPISEGALMLASGAYLIERGAQSENIIFKSAFGSAFLTEIAKTRAFRWLWAAMMKQLSHSQMDARLIGVNLTHHYPINDEHSNILRASSAAMSAALGGVDFIMLQPWNAHWKSEDPFSKRISRNIHNLMKEEGRLDKNLNAADGAYFIEHLTLEIARKMWQEVQLIFAAGGMAEYANSGKLKTSLQKQRTALIETYKDESRILLGVNRFPPAAQLKEVRPEASVYGLLPDYCHIPTEIHS